MESFCLNCWNDLSSLNHFAHSVYCAEIKFQEWSFWKVKFLLSFCRCLFSSGLIYRQDWIAIKFCWISIVETIRNTIGLHWNQFCKYKVCVLYLVRTCILISWFSWTSWRWLTYIGHLDERIFSNNILVYPAVLHFLTILSSLNINTILILTGWN